MKVEDKYREIEPSPMQKALGINKLVVDDKNNLVSVKPDILATILMFCIIILILYGIFGGI